MTAWQARSPAPIPPRSGRRYEWPAGKISRTIWPACMRSGPRTRQARAPDLRRTERHGEGPGPVPVPMPVAFGVRSWRTRNARADADATQTSPRLAGFPGQNTRRDHGRATRTSNGSTHGARPPAGYGGRPLATASIVHGPSRARVHAAGRRCPIRRLLWNSRTCACRLACLVECWPTSCASFQASTESDDRSS